MSATAVKEAPGRDLITPNTKQTAKEIQKFGTVIKNLPIGLSEDVRQKITEKLNYILADTASLRDLYKKSHWQVGGPTFYQLHLLFDKHFGEQAELVDGIAERIQILGRTNELEVWFVSEHLVDMPLTHAK
jgi:starvation-inducible DNA-binding protein